MAVFTLIEVLVPQYYPVNYFSLSNLSRSAESTSLSKFLNLLHVMAFLDVYPLSFVLVSHLSLKLFFCPGSGGSGVANDNTSLHYNNDGDN